MDGAVYFITTKTKGNYPYFRDPILARLLIEELRVAKQMKKFRLYGYVIMPDHLHALIRPFGQFTISQIMFTVKKQFTHEANRIYGWNGKNPAPNAAGGQTFARLRAYVDYNIKTGPRFAWQSSFHDHIIRDERDFENHIYYIHHNPIKAGYVKQAEEWPWSSYREWTNEKTSLLDLP